MNHKFAARLGAVGAAGVCGVLLTTQAAFAAGSESGYKTCASQYYVASKSRGEGEVQAQVGSLVHARTLSSTHDVYNSQQQSLRSNIYWRTYADFNYSASFSGSYCEHL